MNNCIFDKTAFQFPYKYVVIGKSDNKYWRGNGALQRKRANKICQKNTNMTFGVFFTLKNDRVELRPTDFDIRIVCIFDHWLVYAYNLNLVIVLNSRVDRIVNVQEHFPLLPIKVLMLTVQTTTPAF